LQFTKICARFLELLEHFQFLFVPLPQFGGGDAASAEGRGSNRLLKTKTASGRNFPPEAVVIKGTVMPDLIRHLFL
jgi:hypothetical protein